MQVKIHVKTKRYRYLWLKSVTGFDETKCCSKSLLGKYSDILPYQGIVVGTDYTGKISNSAPFHYLCGVTSKYADNLHIAFRHSPGNILAYSNDNIEVLVTDAERVQISEEGVSAPTKQQQTCRNYQFGCNQFKASPEQ